MATTDTLIQIMRETVNGGRDRIIPFDSMREAQRAQQRFNKARRVHRAVTEREWRDAMREDRNNNRYALGTAKWKSICDELVIRLEPHGTGAILILELDSTDDVRAKMLYRDTQEPVYELSAPQEPRADDPGIAPEAADLLDMG